ncbi:interleukin-6 receptor subunit alpha isoform X2 [Dendropsophus ebraccatus]
MESGHLAVDSVTYEDEDGYTCYKDEAPVCSVELRVKDELQENRRLLCYHRHPTHNVTCEWTPEKPLHPSSNVTLIVVRELEPMYYPCSYISPRRLFTCLSLYNEGDSRRHIFYLCVSGRTGSALTANLEASDKELLHVGPPLNVQVTPVQKQTKRLQVTWRRPQFWDTMFYKLEYQVQYQVENAGHPSNLTTWETTFVIDDAVMGRKHLIRVRAREEFHDNWGSWSDEVAGTPWSDTTTPQVPTENRTPRSEEEEPKPRERGDPPPVRPLPVSAWRVSWIAPCVSLGFVLLFFFGIWIRYWEIQILKVKWGAVRSLFHSSSKTAQANPSPLLRPSSLPPSLTVTVPPLPGKE